MASELTSSSSQHSVLFTPPTYVLTYEAKQFLYYLTNDLPPSFIYCYISDQGLTRVWQALSH